MSLYAIYKLLNLCLLKSSIDNLIFVEISSFIAFFSPVFGSKKYLQNTLAFSPPPLLKSLYPVGKSLCFIKVVILLRFESKGNCL